MNILKQLWILTLLYLLGEFITYILPSPLPGNVIGFILLFVALKFNLLKENHIKDISNFFLKNLSILFIPGGVGILKVLNLFNGNILKILLILVLSTIFTMITTSYTIILIERIKK